ncbi:DRBM domain-containing protein [Mycena venus]|uniref:DRBM domain-containing protein n=1 Tax=Mycena venus TaxID=2733690 RepID=A0A8H6Y174_9AGAR|nr:DRBM domain-containing protein [Mycena venus]
MSARRSRSQPRFSIVPSWPMIHQALSKPVPFVAKSSALTRHFSACVVTLNLDAEIPSSVKRLCAPPAVEMDFKTTSYSSGAVPGGGRSVTYLNNYFQVKKPGFILSWVEYSTGPSHAIKWVVVYKVLDQVKGIGIADSKAAAREEAARQALINLGI